MTSDDYSDDPLNGMAINVFIMLALFQMNMVGYNPEYHYLSSATSGTLGLEENQYFILQIFIVLILNNGIMRRLK